MPVNTPKSSRRGLLSSLVPQIDVRESDQRKEVVIDRRSALAVLVATGATACTFNPANPPARPDAALADSGSDAGLRDAFVDATTDAEVADMGDLDAGFEDAEPLDSEPAEAGPTDAEADAGPDDTGVHPDAEVQPDAETIDADVDAGPDDTGIHPDAEIDAGDPDTGVHPDAEVQPDAEPMDADVDAGPTDTGLVDSGNVDAGNVDAGTVPSNLNISIAPSAPTSVHANNVLQPIMALNFENPTSRAIEIKLLTFNVTGAGNLGQVQLTVMDQSTGQSFVMIPSPANNLATFDQNAQKLRMVTRGAPIIIQPGTTWTLNLSAQLGLNSGNIGDNIGVLLETDAGKARIRGRLFDTLNPSLLGDRRACDPSIPQPVGFVQRVRTATSGDPNVDMNCRVTDGSGTDDFENGARLGMTLDPFYTLPVVL